MPATKSNSTLTSAGCWLPIPTPRLHLPDAGYQIQLHAYICRMQASKDIFAANLLVPLSIVISTPFLSYFSGRSAQKYFHLGLLTFRSRRIHRVGAQIERAYFE